MGSSMLTKGSSTHGDRIAGYFLSRVDRNWVPTRDRLSSSFGRRMITRIGCLRLGRHRASSSWGRNELWSIGVHLGRGTESTCVHPFFCQLLV